MVRRVNVSSSSWLLWAFVCLMVCGVSASAQSPDSSRLRSTSGPDFIVAPSYRFSAAPTSVAVGDVNGDGKQDLVITKRVSGSVSVHLGDGNGGFSAGVDYVAGAQPGHVLLADLKGDGKLDIVVTDYATGVVNVLAGNGDGTFAKPVSYPAIARPVAMVLGNFRGQGKRDLAIASAAGVAVLLNDGSGRFGAATSFAIDRQPASIAAADIKGAGHDDLVLANLDGTVRAMLGDGSGHFRSVSLSTVAPESLSSVISGDFNHDGKADLAVTEPTSGKLTILLGRGDGSFQQGASYTVGNGPVSVIAQDLKGDAGTDLITLNRAANTFSVLLGNGDGTFQAPVDFVAGNSPVAAVAGEFYGTGKADLAILNSQDGTISVPQGRGDGSFQASHSYRAGLDRKAVAVGDLDGDGRADLVVSSYCGADSACKSGNATVYLANADGTYRQAAQYALGAGPVAVALADLRGTKKLDLIALNRVDKSITVLPGNGDGSFAAAQTYALSASPSALFVGSLSGKATPEIAITTDCGSSICGQPGNLVIWRNRGDGTLLESASYAVGYSPASIAAADLHGTGKIDLVVANSCGQDSSCKSQGTAMVFSGNGAGRFNATAEFNIGSAPSSIALANLTGSGNDLVVAQRGSNQVAVFLADGKGGFGAPAVYPVGSAPSSLTVADINGDGRQDIAVANFQSSTVSVLFGNAKGKLQPAVAYQVGTGPEAVAPVSPGRGMAFNLVAANGNGGATPMGSDITLLAKPKPLLTAPTSVTLTNSPAISAADAQVTLTATVAGASGTATGNVVFSTVVGAVSTPISDCGGAAGATLNGAGSVTCLTQLLPVGTDTVQANYLGDIVYSALPSNTVSQTVSKTTPTVALTSTGASFSVDQTVAVTATIAPTTPTVATDVLTIAGAVSFTDGGNPIASCASVTPTFSAATGHATAVCNLTGLTVGSHSIAASYAGNATYNTASSTSSLALTITTANSTTTVAAAPAAPAVNQSVTYTATVAPSVAPPPVPANEVTITGTVVFKDGASTILGCDAQPVVFSAVTGSGTATCTVASLAAGIHLIVATYAGDTNYGTSVSSTLGLTVTKAATSIAVTATPASPSVAASVTYQATVTATANPPVATELPIAGSVSFTDGGTTITGCGAQSVVFNVLGQGLAQCTTTAGAAGAHSIVAVYTGDTNYNGVTLTPALSVTVTKGNTSLALASSVNPSSLNQSVTFTATVTPPTGSAIAFAPASTVAFTDNGASITGCTAQSLTAGVATCATSALTGGHHSVVATFSGDVNYNGSNNNVAQTVSTAASTTALVSAPSATTTINQAVTFTATIGPLGGSAALTGTVTFTDGGGPLAGCTVNFVPATGTATCTTSSLALGAHTVKATYAGDTSYTTSNATITQTVTQAATSVALASSISPSAINQSVTFTATVTPTPSGSTALSGSVAFTDNGTAITNCSAVAVVPATGVATCSTSTLTGGAHTIKATYGSDTNFSSSNNTITQTISSALTSLAVITSLNPSTVNQTVSFTATVTAPAGNTALSGKVNFTDNGTAIAGCTGLVPTAAGVAICSDQFLTAAGSPHTITATYTNDTNFAGSSNNVAPAQVVSAAAGTLALSSSPNPSSFNQSVTFTATVSVPAGGVGLSGKVAFNDGLTAAAIPGCGAVSPAANGVASCPISTLSIGTHNITAAYGSDANFTVTPSSAVAQSVGKTATTTAIIANFVSIAVNNSVIFTATVSSTAKGNTPFTGSMAFSTNGIGIACNGAAAAAPLPVDATTGVANCATSALLAGSDTILASYSNDTNFAGSTDSLVEQVVAGSASINLSSSTLSAPIFAVNPSDTNDAVTFTASFLPVHSGPVALTGSMIFTDEITANSSTTTAIICTVPLQPGDNGETCTCGKAVGNCKLASGSNKIFASYVGDPNFTPTPSTPVLQLVEDYALVVSSTPPVIVTQGSTTTKDPFSPQTISVAPVSIENFSGTLALSCIPQAVAGATPPVCKLANSTLAVASVPPQQSVGIVIDATQATSTASQVTPGVYTFTVSGTDSTTGLVRSAASFLVTVRSVSTPLTVASGATTGNSGNVTFNLPAGLTLSNLSCPSMSGTGITGAPGVAPSSFSVACSFGTVTYTPASGTASVTVTVTTGSGAVAAIANHSNIFAAGLLGIPLFGLIGLIRGRKSTKSAIYRLLAIVALCAAGMQVLGCGGSFQRPVTPGSGKTPPGVYYVLVQGNGSDSQQYQAVLELHVTL